ncbi:hypothetical protein L484_025452 [Morus notabilis]|uniref:ZF-HD dimerization-type domain-containing protein n=1 Tax=Morus notabilis TaxID=981085 RepID=W9RNK7_9ROSA|nr:zinc-finger homeodomain protein 2 [Morus notabilis]EXC01084.1 hypothetical protein L484_025452 [Morus notabilis]
MDLSVVPYKHHHNSANNKADNESEDGDVVEPKNNAANNNNNNLNNKNILNSNCNDVKYKECMRNHAASIGGHANDGCGEFMPSSAEAEKSDMSPSSLTCAACGCHRNFHRREIIGCEQNLLYPVHSPPPQPVLLYNAVGPATPRWDPKMSVVGPPRRHQIHSLHRNGSGGGGRGIVEAREGRAECGAEVREYYDRRSSETPEREDVSAPSAMAGSGGGGKRFRTKFTLEQKDRMLAFADRIGWRIQRQDDVAINQFCSEIGVKRNVLKVWMHNNKNAHRRRESAPPSLAEAPTPPTPQAVGV